MVVLLRTLANLPEPSRGYDMLPYSTDTRPTDDLARIKYYRNQMEHDYKNGKINSTSFKTVWEDITGVRKYCII